MANIDKLQITTPCAALWTEMEGDDRARFCELCSKVVHDTTGLTTCELERLMAAPKPPCLRVHRDPSGRVLTRDRLAAIMMVGLAACTGGAPDSGDTADTASADRVTVSAPLHDTRSMGTGSHAGPTPEARSIPESTGLRQRMRNAWNRVVSTSRAPVPEVPEAPEVHPMLGEPMIGDVAPMTGGAAMPHETPLDDDLEVTMGRTAPPREPLMGKPSRPADE